MSFLNLGSIRKNLALLVFLTVLPALIILFYSGMEERRNTTEYAKKDVQMLAHAMAQVQTELTISARQILSTLALITEVQALNAQSSSDIFKTLLKKNPKYRNITLVDLSGNVIASGLPSKAANLADRKHVRDALKTKDFAAGEYIVTRVGNSAPAFPFAYPVLDTTGTPKAILTVAVSLEVFSELYQESLLPPSSYVAVTDHQGVRLFYYPAKVTNPIGKPIKTSNWKIARDAQEPGIMTSPGSDGVIRIGAFEQIHLNANAAPYMYAWAGVPESFVLAPANTILKRNLLLMLLTTIVAFFASWSVGRKTLIAPINQLKEMTNELAKGNLEAHIEQTSQIGEFKELIVSFQEMAKSLSISQEQLQKSGERFMKLSGVTFEGISIHKEGIVIDCNDSMVRLFGYTREEIIGKNTIALAFPSESQLIIHENISKNVTTPYEVIARKKNGTLFPIEIESREITEGEDHYRVTAARDITERRRMQADQEKLLAAIHQTDEIIVITDVEAKIQYVNPAFEKITGYNSKEVVGKNPSILQGNQANSAFYDEMWTRLSSGKTWAGQLVNKKKDGSFYTEEASISPIFDANGTIINYVGVKRDITEKILDDKNRQELETQLRQKHKMEAVGYMAGGMAHNFNNNLGIILGNVELSQMKQPRNSDVIPLLENAKIAVGRSRDLILKIITYSRQGIQQKAPTQLTAITDETISLLKSTLPATVALQKGYSPDCDKELINADASQIQEVLINLCNNAIQAMQEKGELKIQLKPVELTQREIPAQYDCLPGRYAKISVQDNGCGMPKEMLDKIFDPFYTTKEAHEGAGMGLSTVQGIVAQHGGIIKVNSVPNQGTTFNLYFPIIKQTHIDQPTAENMTLPRGTERILFVDDDEMLASLGEKLLTSMGYQVSVMTESTEALKMFAANAEHFALVITDQTMPQLCGKDLIQELKKIRPDIPTILCTGFSSKVNEDNAEELGISAFMMKPLDLIKLAQTVRRVLDGVEIE